MHVRELHYELPPELIARHPAERRDESRLLLLHQASGAIAHHHFRDLPDLLPPGALLVLNDTRVLPARLLLRRESGAELEGLYLREPEPGLWEIMLTGSRRLKPGERLEFAAETGSGLRLVDRTAEGTWQVRPDPPEDTAALLDRVGRVPLPPYIRRERKSDTAAGDESNTPEDSLEQQDRARYQTVYAEQPGSVAAPTAGLHFTPELLTELDRKGFQTARVTLHVGVGTFQPIRGDDLTRHDMHAERYEVAPSAAEVINTARAERRPIVAVGTTSVRVLETCADAGGNVRPGTGESRLFIYPPYRYRCVDALITNFHLPESTLLAMVFALAGRDNVRNAYQEAIQQGYHFYSYGDAMLIR